MKEICLLNYFQILIAVKSFTFNAKRRVAVWKNPISRICLCDIKIRIPKKLFKICKKKEKTKFNVTGEKFDWPYFAPNISIEPILQFLVTYPTSLQSMKHNLQSLFLYPWWPPDLENEIPGDIQEISKFFHEIILRFDDFNFSLIIDKIKLKRKL